MGLSIISVSENNVCLSTVQNSFLKGLSSIRVYVLRIQWNMALIKTTQMAAQVVLISAR